MPELLTFESRPEQAAQLANATAKQLDQAMRDHGDAHVSVPGGSTPVLFFDALSRHKLAWWRVFVSLNDDRDVPADHEASNVGLVRKHLLQHEAQQAVLLPLPQAAAKTADVLVLGMGEDGHTASLFPGAPELVTALDPAHSDKIVYIIPDPLPPHAPYPRTSLTLSAILSAKQIYLLISGRIKLQVYEQALTADPVNMPVAAVLRQDIVPVYVYWAP
jgi:6-phosphogluconolactonase